MADTGFYMTHYIFSTFVKLLSNWTGLGEDTKRQVWKRDIREWVRDGKSGSDWENNIEVLEERVMSEKVGRENKIKTKESIKEWEREIDREGEWREISALKQPPAERNLLDFSPEC